MEPKRHRRFTVLDAIILIAAIGVGLAWMREFSQTKFADDTYPYLLIINGSTGSKPIRAALLWVWWVDASYNLVAALTFASLSLRAFSPRPGLQRLTRQPGAVACAAAAVAASVEILSVIWVAVGVYLARKPWSEFWTTGVNIQGTYESLAVFVVWLLLLLSGRWKIERDWVERLGLILGVFWLVVPPLQWLVRDVVINGIWVNW